MSGLLMIFMIFLFLMVFLPAMMYLLPVFLIIWLVSALVNSFRPRRQTGKGGGMGGNGRTFYYYRSSNPGHGGAMNRNPEIEKRAARPDSIDAEYTEVEVRDDTRDPQ